eukprot:TRINITY_DN12983_c0_g1::TRINITY_DN12983_c0_g1_i1::g.11114::m.11114 TRINITY_DN12983_c0_g1::TRINITY_DN12983_c0_g1_i1::g.11114  ORF type:complete len:325 (+),score=27.15,sp/Q8BQS5/ADR2_MOUSE/37.64/1e-43,HlyIII/PF03006.15/5.5e-54 TRINITY_DN12983_c0_g1_i1:93-1067(+)
MAGFTTRKSRSHLSAKEDACLQQTTSCKDHKSHHHTHEVAVHHAGVHPIHYDGFNFPTFPADMTPPWLRQRAITRGYRVGLSFRACCFSMFRLHNESCNIWTHVFGFFVVLSLAIYTYVQYLSGSGLADKIVFAIFLLSAMAMTIFSVLYHQFQCLSQKAANLLIRMDMAGIAFLILGSFFPVVHYGFYCENQWRSLYLGIMTALALLTVGVSITLTGERYFYHRTALFVSLTFIGILPFSHMTSIHGFSPFSFILRMLGSYLTGAIFHASRFPESFFPGRFDLFGNSHSIFHMFVVLGVVTHLMGCINLFTTLDRDQCTFAEL